MSKISMENAKKSDAKAKISYRDSLDTITKARYVNKLKEIDGKDPYEMGKAEWSADTSPRRTPTSSIILFTHRVHTR